MLPPDWQNTIAAYNEAMTRRQFFRHSGTGLGVAALSALLGQRVLGAGAATLAMAMNEPWRIAP